MNIKNLVLGLGASLITSSCVVNDIENTVGTGVESPGPKFDTPAELICERRINCCYQIKDNDNLKRECFEFVTGRSDYADFDDCVMIHQSRFSDSELKCLADTLSCVPFNGNIRMYWADICGVDISRFE